MTFSMGASGTVDAVRDILTQQAEQYAEELVGHVHTLLGKVLDTLQVEHGVTVSASGHSDANGVSFSVNARPLAPSELPTPPPPGPAPVS